MSDIIAFAEAFRKLRSIKNGSDSKIAVQTIAMKSLAKAEIDESDRKEISGCMMMMTVMVLNHPRRNAAEDRIEEILARYGVESPVEKKNKKEGQKNA